VDGARTRFVLCVTAALLVHGLVFAWLLPWARSGDTPALLTATRATGAEATDMHSVTRAAHSQRGADAGSADRRPAATTGLAAADAGAASAVTRFVMITTPKPTPGAAAARPASVQTTGADRDAVRQARRAMADQRAAYLTSWQNQIEAVASTRYSKQISAAGGRSLTLAVQLGADGALRAVRVMRSSGNTQVDALARRIVQESAPFPVFDSTLARRTDELRFAYDWVFDTQTTGALR